MGDVVVQDFLWGCACGRRWINSLHEVPIVND